MPPREICRPIVARPRSSQGPLPTIHLPSNPRNIARFSPAVSIGQSAISLSVRLQPSHQPVRGSIRQVLSQGLGGSRIAAHHGRGEGHAASRRFQRQSHLNQIHHSSSP